MQTVVEQVALRCEGTGRHHALNWFLLLELIESLQFREAIEGLGWPDSELVQTIYIELRIGIVEALRDDHLSLIDGVLGHLVQVQLDSVLGGAIFISKIE